MTSSEYQAGLRGLTPREHNKFSKGFDAIADITGRDPSDGPDWAGMRSKANAILAQYKGKVRTLLEHCALDWIEQHPMYGLSARSIQERRQQNTQAEMRGYERWVLRCAATGQLCKLCSVDLADGAYLPRDVKDVLDKHGVTYPEGL